MKEANEHILIIAQIKTKEAIDNMDAILTEQRAKTWIHLEHHF